MIQIETIENLNGFGDRNQEGESHYSQNLTPSQYGLQTNLSIVNDTFDSTPVYFNWFSYWSGVEGMYALDDVGDFYFRTAGEWARVADTSASVFIANPTLQSGQGLFPYRGSELYTLRDRNLSFLNTAYEVIDASTATVANTYNTGLTGLVEMEQFEDWIFIARDNTSLTGISSRNITDNSFTTSAFDLPSNFEVRSIKANKNGLLIGANYGTRSVLILWDGRSLRSITDWLWLDYPIQSICRYKTGWIVTTSKAQYITDGYSANPIPSIPDAVDANATFNTHPAGTIVVDNKLYTSNNATSYNRLKAGVYVQDLDTGLFSFLTVGNTNNVTMGTLYYASGYGLFLSYKIGTTPYAATIAETPASTVTLTTPRLGQGNNNKVAEAVKLDITPSIKNTSVNATGSFTVSAKIYNFKRPLWGYGETNATGGSSSKLRVDGTASGTNNAKIGDEVTILTGADAGKVRHITAIANEGASNEEWTLDSALSTSTVSGVKFNVQPFQLIKSKAITISSYSEIESIYFDIRNRIKGRKYLIKFVITDITNVSLTLPSVTFIYDDLGLI